MAIIVALGMSLPGPSAASAPSASPSSPDATTSPHYEDARKHAGDRIDFAPGDVAALPFTPRQDDGWSIGGKPPRRLPAGRRSGEQIREMAPGETAASVTSEPSAAPTPDPTPTPTPDPTPTPTPDPTAPSALMAADVLAAPVGGGLRREVFGFLPYWEMTDSTTRLDYSVLSTIAYFGVQAGSDGHLVRQRSGVTEVGWAGWSSSALTRIIGAAHAGGTRVVLTVERFAWTSSDVSATSALLASATRRQILATEIAAAVRDRGADGVNLDFEPIPSGQGANFVTFVRQVRAALDAQAPGYQLTFDATGWIGRYDIAGLTADGAADAVVIMAYDYRTSGAASAGSVSPLIGPTYDLTDTVAAYLARTAATKIILGVPYYGRAWSTTSSAVHAATRPGSATYGYSSSVVYGTAVGMAADHGRLWDATEDAPWTEYRWQYCSSCPTTWRQLYYDDAQSLGLKYDLVNARGLRGAGIWALGYEGTRPELYATLSAKFVDDGTPPRAGITIMPAVSSEQIVRVAWTGLDDLAAVDRYDVQVSADGGDWSPWLTATTATSASFAGSAGHGYAFRVRARDTHGIWAAWEIDDRWSATTAPLGPGAFARVAVATLNLRASPDTAALRVGGLVEGQLVEVVAGPVDAVGYHWYEVQAPLSEWGTVDPHTLSGVWVAGGSADTAYLSAVPSPNTTAVDPVILGLGLGATDVAALTAATDAASTPTSGGDFSPNGDGRNDALRVSYRLDRTLDSLTLRILSAGDRGLAGTVPLPGLAAGDHIYDWDGHVGGVALPDGRYLVQLVGRAGSATYGWPAADLADPAIATDGLAVTIDTVRPALSSLAASAANISPNADGTRDVATLTASTDATAAWTLRIGAAGGAVLRGWDGAGPALSASWDGRDAAGGIVQDGTYTVTATATDAAGNAASVSRVIGVDTVAPSGALAVSVPARFAGATPRTFTPNGDGEADTATLGWTLGEPASGTLSVRSSTRTVWSRPIPLGVGGAVTWDGRDTAGVSVASGTYALVASVADAAGNRTTLRSTVTVNRTAGFLRWSPTSWYPQDGDALAASSRLSFRLTRSAYTTLRIYDAAGTIVRHVWSSRFSYAGTRSWTWNGRDDAGQVLPQGTYRALLISSAGGINTYTTRSTRLAAFTVTPSASTRSAGQALTVAVRTSEPLLRAPMVTLTQPGLAAVTVRAVHLADGSYRAAFTIAAGPPGAATIIVRGTDSGGRTNTTTTSIGIQ
jgi:spore germination protein YaaH/flagellar hook assembly protein FlgD